MVGFPTAAAGTPPYPLLGSGRERFSGVARSCSARESTHVHRTGFSRTVSGLLWGETVRSHLGSVCGSQCGSGPGCRLASAVKSQLLLGPCAIRPGGRLVPAQPSSGRLPGPDQAPCGQADRPAWRLPTRPTLSAHARTSRQPCVELPARKLCGETGPSHNHPRPRAVHLAVVPEIQAWSGEGNARVLDLCWGRRCHPARVEAQNGKFVRHSRTLTTRTASAG